MKTAYSTLLVLAAFAVLACAQDGTPHLDDPNEENALPFVQAIEHALTKGEVESAADVHDILCGQLASESEQMRGRVLYYLRDHATRIRFFEYEGCLASSNPTLQQGTNDIMDLNQLMWSGDATAVGIYTRCIVSGQVQLWRGLTLHRFHCMGGAAAQGLIELEPLVDAYYDQLDTGAQEVMPHSELTALFEMSGGTGGPDAARTRAVEYLEKTEPAVAVRRLDNDRGFAKAVADVAVVVCGSVSDPRCQEMCRVADVWSALSREQRRAAGEEVEWSAPPAWVTQLSERLEGGRSFARYGPMAAEKTLDELLIMDLPAARPTPMEDPDRAP